MLLLKVDVEGWEWSVFKGAIGLIKDFKVENIIMEYSPGERETWVEIYRLPCTSSIFFLLQTPILTSLSFYLASDYPCAPVFLWFS